MKIIILKEDRAFSEVCFKMPYNKLSKNILRLLYPIYKNHFIYIVKEYECTCCDFEKYEVVVVLTYEEFLNSEV